MDHILKVTMTKTLASTMIMLVPSDLIGCLPIQPGSLTMPTVTLNQRKVCT